MLDQLSELDAEKLVELQSAIVSEFETVEKEDPSPQTVDAMTSLADMLDTVRGEISRREAQAQELAARAAEAAMRVKGDEMKEEMPEGETDSDSNKEEKEMPEEAPAAPVKKEEKEEDKSMAEASTTVEEASELSTPEETPVATQEVAATEVTPAAEAAATEVTPAAEAAVAEETPAEAAAEVTPEAELSAEPTENVEAPAAEVATEPVAASAEIEVSATPETTDVAQNEQKDQEAPVTAAANETEVAITEVIEAPADRRPSLQTSAATVAITAGADIPGYTAGSTIDNMSEVAEAMSKRLHGLRRVNGGDGEQHIVASITTQYPEERTLSTDAESNWKKVQNVVGPEALVAAGAVSLK